MVFTNVDKIHSDVQNNLVDDQADYAQNEENHELAPSRHVIPALEDVLKAQDVVDHHRDDKAEELRYQIIPRERLIQPRRTENQIQNRIYAKINKKTDHTHNAKLCNLLQQLFHPVPPALRL